VEKKAVQKPVSKNEKTSANRSKGIAKSLREKGTVHSGGLKKREKRWREKEKGFFSGEKISSLTEKKEK